MIMRYKQRNWYSYVIVNGVVIVMAYIVLSALISFLSSLFECKLFVDSLYIIISYHKDFESWLYHVIVLFFIFLLFSDNYITISIHSLSPSLFLLVLSYLFLEMI